MKVRALSTVLCVACVGLAGAFYNAGAAQQKQQQVQGAAPGAPLPALVPTAAMVATPPEITITDTPAGSLFADRKGFTLYVTERDKEPGKSTCAGPCAEQWVPLRSESDAKPFGDWTLVARTDGQPQWAYKGRPLYRYRWEAKPKWAEAQNEVWRYATVANFPAVSEGRRGYTPPNSNAKIVLPVVPGGIGGGPTKFGIVFVDIKQMTLYSQSVVAACTGACLESWKPLSAPQVASPVGDWTIVTRNDGSRQWAYQGRPVYRSLLDVKPSDANGASDKWKPVLVSSADKTPTRAAQATPASRAPSQLSRGTAAVAPGPATPNKQASK
jgi:predicted lipoprotein with Yx(FWY)xxD motif